MLSVITSGERKPLAARAGSRIAFKLSAGALQTRGKTVAIIFFRATARHWTRFIQSRRAPSRSAGTQRTRTPTRHTNAHLSCLSGYVPQSRARRLDATRTRCRAVCANALHDFEFWPASRRDCCWLTNPPPRSMLRCKFGCFTARVATRVWFIGNFCHAMTLCSG
jgi:hypothetical protein